MIYELLLDAFEIQEALVFAEAWLHGGFLTAMVDGNFDQLATVVRALVGVFVHVALNVLV